MTVTPAMMWGKGWRLMATMTIAGKETNNENEDFERAATDGKNDGHEGKKGKEEWT